MSINRLKRIISIDILRTFAILSSIVQHYYFKANISFLAVFFIRVQDNLFSVGEVFIFVSGIMAYLIYLPRYQERPALTSRKLISKGILILLVYVLYVNFFRFIQGVEIPTNIIRFLIFNGNFLEILLTFSLIYLFTPIILFLISKLKKLDSIFYFLPFLLLLPELILYFFKPSDFWKVLFLSQANFAYSFLPMLAIYIFGLLAGHIYVHFSNQKFGIKNKYAGMIFFTIIFYTVIIIFLMLFPNILNILKLIFSAFNIFLLLVFLEMLIEYKTKIKRIKLFENFLLIGKNSLLAYVTANTIIVFLPKTFSYQMYVQYMILLLVVFVTYAICLLFNLYTKLEKNKHLSGL